MIVLNSVGVVVWTLLFVDYVWGDYQPSRWFIAFLLGFIVFQFIVKLIDAWLER